MEQRDSDLLKGMIAGALVSGTAGDQGSQSGTNPTTAKGCWGCLAILLVLGMFGAVFEHFGCVASERNLRERVDVAVTGISLQREKKLAWVDFTLSNRSKWSVSVSVECEVFNTTQQVAVVTNSILVRDLKPHSESKQRLAFDLDELTRNGISDPTDKDRCRVQLTIRRISKAGEEESVR